MNEKQYKVRYFEDPNPVDSYVENSDGEYLNTTDVAKLLNELSQENEKLRRENELKGDFRNFINEDILRIKKENKELKIQLQNTSTQRDEFYTGARENANRVGKLKNKNEQLKQQNKQAIDLILDGIMEIHDGKRDYAETLFNKAIELIK